MAVSGQTSIVGDTIALIDCNGLQGRFSTVTVDGFKATALYSASGLQIHLDA